MTSRFNLYLAKAGHMAMMAEFLMRGWNVAIPEVDIGDDIFVVQDEEGTLKRIQVKTATSNPLKNGYAAQFNVPRQQLEKEGKQKIYYAFIVRHQDDWSKPLIIRQDFLKDYVQNQNVGSVNENQVKLHVTFLEGGVKCSNHDFSVHVSDYSDFEFVSHQTQNLV
jgi:hypothetical protein